MRPRPERWLASSLMSAGRRRGQPATSSSRGPKVRRSPLRPNPRHRYISGGTMLEGKKVVLAYSGGLDTSVCVKWLEQQGAEPYALYLDLGQGEPSDDVKAKALEIGAADAFVWDARAEFVGEYVAPAIKANALYGGKYPLFTALGRPLIARKLVEAAREVGASHIAHGSTGKGNDQVRFDVDRKSTRLNSSHANISYAVF